MNDDLQNAKMLLKAGGHTCVMCCGNGVYTSNERGVKPLLGLLQSGDDFSSFSAADKVVGKAAAFLYVLMDVRAVHAGVMSVAAAEVLERFGIDTSFDICVASIINRSGTGLCPMEEAVMGIGKPSEALAAIKEKLKQMATA